MTSIYHWLNRLSWRNPSHTHHKSFIKGTHSHRTRYWSSGAATKTYTVLDRGHRGQHQTRTVIPNASHSVHTRLWILLSMKYATEGHATRQLSDSHTIFYPQRFPGAILIKTSIKGNYIIHLFSSTYKVRNSFFLKSFYFLTNSSTNTLCQDLTQWRFSANTFVRTFLT